MKIRVVLVHNIIYVSRYIQNGVSPHTQVPSGIGTNSIQGHHTERVFRVSQKEVHRNFES